MHPGLRENGARSSDVEIPLHAGSLPYPGEPTTPTENERSSRRCATDSPTEPCQFMSKGANNLVHRSHKSTCVVRNNSGAAPYLARQSALDRTVALQRRHRGQAVSRRQPGPNRERVDVECAIAKRGPHG